MWKTIGQQKAINILEKEFNSGKLSHAYLFIGPNHVGKMTLALDLAQLVNCLNDKKPCGSCYSCTKIITNKHPDITFIGLNNVEKNSETKYKYEISIEEIRKIQKSANLPPYEGNYRVIIINNAEHLSDEAANCLLKILEEPLTNLIFILLVTDDIFLLPTIRSRCQKIELKPLSSFESVKVLNDTFKINNEKAEFLSKLSGGCIGLALSTYMDDSYLQIRNNQYSDLLPLLEAKWNKRFKYITEIEGTRKNAEHIFKSWSMWWRDIMLAKCQCYEGIINVDYINTLKEWASLMSLPDIITYLNLLQNAIDYINKNANPKLVFEILMLEMPRIKKTIKDT